MSGKVGFRLLGWSSLFLTAKLIGPANRISANFTTMVSASMKIVKLSEVRL
jgi:hypothetical protein